MLAWLSGNIVARMDNECLGNLVATVFPLATVLCARSARGKYKGLSFPRFFRGAIRTADHPDYSDNIYLYLKLEFFQIYTE